MRNSFFSRFTPKEPKFFPLLRELSEILTQTAALLTESVAHSTPDERRGYYQRIKEKEREADTVAHRIFDQLGTTFITPFDREDIHQLASHIDDVIDEINSSAKRIAIYHPRPIGAQGQELCRLIEAGAVLIRRAMDELETFRKDPATLVGLCGELHDIENRADDIYEEFTTQLFRYETDFVEIIKIKEIMHELERTTDRAEYVAKILKNFIVKYA
jgi:predicted phosphate transport protein (TIGR00153 family)